MSRDVAIATPVKKSNVLHYHFIERGGGRYFDPFYLIASDSITSK